MLRTSHTNGSITLPDEWAERYPSCVFYIGNTAYSTTRDSVDHSIIHIGTAFGGSRIPAPGDMVTIVAASATGTACADTSLASHHIAADAVNAEHFADSSAYCRNVRALSTASKTADDAAALIFIIT